MNLLERVQNHFTDSIETQKIAMRILPTKIVNAALMMSECLARGNKILACGNGGSASDAQHFAAELVNRFMINRAPLAAIALTTDGSTLTSIANDYDYTQVFSRQIQALSDEGDILLAISTSGNSANIIEAINAAKDYGMTVIALTGKDGGEVGALIEQSDEDDLEIRVVEDSTPRIQETHIFVIHCLCDLIEQRLFAAEEVVDGDEEAEADENEVQ
jgi:phosphoheptose isomerase